MLQGQAAYGGQRAQVDDGVLALGRNLHPILPEDVYDVSPQSRSTFLFAADVRLDNRPELSARLGLAPADHKRLPDSALLFEALLRWGDDAVDHLVGEFAFAFWDGARQHLLLGRDILGLRPLHFHVGKNFFAFASMPSGLHALGGVVYDFDPDFMRDSLSLKPRSGERTHFRDISRVEPGTILRVTRDGLQSHKYWRPSGPTKVSATPGEYEEGLRGVLDQAVTAQLRGAGDTVACQLSGGLDSATVTATAARLMPAGKVVAFTAVPRAGFAGRGPRGTIADESALAAATARLYPNIEHVVVPNSGESPLKWLDPNFHYQQQPQANLANAVWGKAIHRAAQSRGLNTILKAGAGNMSISYSGLEWLPFLLSRGRLPTLARRASAIARDGMPLLSLGAQTIGPFLPRSLFLALRRLGGRKGATASFSPASRTTTEGRGSDSAGRVKDPFEIRLAAFSRVDGGNALKGALAESGLSVRDPTADKRVIEYCLSVPPGEFVRDGVPRSLARRAFADRLPPEVASFRQRGYQSADWYEALDKARAEIEQEVAAIGRCEAAAEALDLDWLNAAIEDWPKGGWEHDQVMARYRLGLLRGISAGHFMRKVRGTN